MFAKLKNGFLNTPCNMLYIWVVLINQQIYLLFSVERLRLAIETRC